MEGPSSLSSHPITPLDAHVKPPSPPRAQNPALRMLGLPNFRFRLPSRNWLIFFSVTGSFVGTLIYDRRERRRVEEKWSHLVAHIANDPLRPNEARRKITVFLSAPPGDSLRAARDHFREYVKPILVAGAIDYEIVEGRKEGDIRAALASRIRKVRRLSGEGSTLSDLDKQDDSDTKLRSLREITGVHDEPTVKGDLVIGRHSWKEYIRGLHEGWLGPLTAPPTTVESQEHLIPPQNEESTASQAPAEEASHVVDVQLEDKKEEAATLPTDKKQEQQKKIAAPTPSFLLPSSYHKQQTPTTIPQELDPSIPIAFPHLLGFLNTPIRIYRFLNRRRVADDIGREVAAAVLASAARPYKDTQGIRRSDCSIHEPMAQNSQPDSVEYPSSTCHEQQTVLAGEEKEWHKSVHKLPSNPDLVEREWLDDVMIDPRIGSRMRRFVLSPEEETRSKRIAEGQEWILGEEWPPYIPTWKKIWISYGWGEDDAKKKVVIGNLDGE
ncbi:mitochondrial import inner membrane translocase subunit tim54 [Myotisia sp. PD_48]|nr:mitochondrial import inner membrane translocase subunit tim54 [Myotisia sp. PD_48]